MGKRSETPFPKECNDLIGFFKNAWELGWLDSYSSDHFIIKCICRELTKVEGEWQLLFNNSAAPWTPVSSDGKINYDIFATNFIINLSAKLKGMSETFGEDKIKDFVENQLAAGKNSYNPDAFFQALSEIEVLSFYCGKADWENAIYEPPVGTKGSNPEARFIIKNYADNTAITTNIEVKTPKFPELIQHREKTAIPTILLSDEGRKEFQQLCAENKFKCIMPRVTKLVDFINSAAKKFEKPSENEFNLLFINWSYSDFPSNSFLEPWYLLTNNKNGILTFPCIGTTLPFKEPICKEAYEKITAVIVYTSSLDQLMFSDFRHVWQGTTDVGPRFRMFVLDKKLREDEWANRSNILSSITGMKPSILEPQKWRVLIDCNWNDSTTSDSRAEDCKFQLELLKIVNDSFLTS